MNWTQPGQGYSLDERAKYSQYKFRMQGGKQVGLGPAVGMEVEWSPSDRDSILIKAPEPLSPAHKLAIKHVTAHFAGQRIIKVNGTVVDKGRKDIAKDKSYTDYRPGWGKNWVPIVQNT